MQQRTKAICRTGIVQFSKSIVECYVTGDGRRMVSNSGLIRAIVDGPKHGTLERYIEAIPSQFRPKASAPNVELERPEGGIAICREATFLIDLCEAYDKADEAGALRADQRHLAQNARRILRATARAGIVGLIDEATGYQQVRPSNDLQNLLSRVLREEPDTWVRRYNPSFVESMCQLYRHEWDRRRFPQWLSPIIAKFYELVLGEEVLRELHEKCPTPGSGNNKHQWLQTDIQRLLERDIVVMEVLAQQSRTPEEFWDRMNYRYKRMPLQMALGIA